MPRSPNARRALAWTCRLASATLFVAACPCVLTLSAADRLITVADFVVEWLDDAGAYCYHVLDAWLDAKADALEAPDREDS